jgi:hypothetical protein
MGMECVEFICKEFLDDEELKIKALGAKHTGLTALGVSSKDCAQACDYFLSSIEKYESTTQVQVIPSSILEQKYVAQLTQSNTLKRVKTLFFRWDTRAITCQCCTLISLSQKQRRSCLVPIREKHQKISVSNKGTLSQY